MHKPVDKRAVSVDTIRLSLEALLYMEVGVKSWATLEDEDGARRVASNVRTACNELRGALADG